MRLFGRRKTANVRQQENAFVNHVANAAQRYQAKVSGYLNRKTQYWNRASKLTAFILFCLLFGGCCLLLLIKAIVHF
jgi:hypothetical protein